MSGRYQQLGPLDETAYGDNDANFLGVNMRADPQSLPSGMVSSAKNMVFRQGIAEPRYGFTTKPWSRQLGVDFTIDFPFSFTKSVGFGKVFGACTFADPNGEERQIIVCATKSWSITPHAPPSTILYPPNVEITAPVTFTQAFQVLIMWRGKEANPLKLDTALEFSVEPVWEEVPDETNEDYTSTIPDASRGLHYGNRVWVPFGNSEVAYSDVLAYTRYDADLSTLWVNEGESDILLSLAAYGQNAIVAFKSRSIYSIENVLPDPGVAARSQILTTQRGLIAPETVSQVGRDLWFLSDDGVYAISQVLDNALQAGSEPVTAPMEPLLRRVHWAAAPRACAIYHDAKYFLALPVDGSGFNNVILVYDFINSAWSGHWQSPFMDVAYFLRIDVAGHRRLAFVSGDAIAGNEGKLYVMEGGYHDESFGVEADVETEILTRGYMCGLPVDKMFLGCGAELATWYGAGEVTVIRDGVNEQARLASYAKDRLKYNLFARRSYDPTNVNDDFLAPFRQDYSVKLLPLGSESTPTSGTIINATGVSRDEVNSAISLATDGDTVVIPVGSATWTTGIDLGSKAITVRGAGTGQTNITNNQSGIRQHLFSFTTHATIPTRFTGISFDGGTDDRRMFGVDASLGQQCWRIDNCTFLATEATVFIDVYGDGPGLIDNCPFTAPDNAEMIHVYGNNFYGTGGDGWSDDVIPGGPNACYIEDCSFTNNGGWFGCSAVQSYDGARTVFRYNTLNYVQIDQHGHNEAVGARWWEIYENTFSIVEDKDDQDKYMDLRAGSGVVFNNHTSGLPTDAQIVLREEDSGYPALYQIGRGIDQHLSPAYLWGNDAAMEITTYSPDDGPPENVIEDRDFFVSTTQPSSMVRWQLTTDSAATTYSYVPYTYPHPLRSATPSTGPDGIQLGTGVVLGLHQYSSERMRIRQDSRYVQLRLRGTRGRNKVRAVSIGAHGDFLPTRSTI